MDIFSDFRNWKNREFEPSVNLGHYKKYFPKSRLRPDYTDYADYTECAAVSNSFSRSLAKMKFVKLLASESGFDFVGYV